MNIVYILLCPCCRNVLCVCLYGSFIRVGVLEYPVPSNASVEDASVAVEAYEHAHRCAHDVVLGNEAPEAGVL